MRTTKYIIAFSCLFLTAFINTEYNNSKISSNVSMDIHKDLQLVPMNELQLKFEANIAPMAVYESVDQEVKLVVRLIKEAEDSTTKTIFKNPDAKKSNVKDLTLERMFKKSAIASQFDKINFTKDSLKTINGVDFLIYEFEAEAQGLDAQSKPITTTSYAYYQMGYVKNKNYIFNFYCPLDRKEEWKSRVQWMMNSVKIRK